jgi:hypothetical protein
VIGPLGLSLADIPACGAETTRRKKAPSLATLDKEVELLKRMLNYAWRATRSRPIRSQR